ncbi:MAG: hypothetical protein IPK26_15545 [Planctomycetes bacterium]|nr:hypothetical protein [Planctomycetota bacterium]
MGLFRGVVGTTVDHAVTIPPVTNLLGEALFLQAATLTNSAAAATATLAGFVGP